MDIEMFFPNSNSKILYTFLNPMNVCKMESKYDFFLLKVVNITRRANLLDIAFN